MQYTEQYFSPLGGITLASDGQALTGLWFQGQKYYGRTLGTAWEARDLPIFRQAKDWLDVYFSGRVPDFTPPLRPMGTDFQRRVWAALAAIPYGETRSYGDIARELSCTSARAVGGAVGKNPISLIIPCHRVTGAGGSLTGYAGGLDRKAALLALEQGR